MLSIKMILRDVSADPQGWEKLISTMAANYKYGFSRQLYIYAQKPQATACADIQLWNRLGRWVKKGAKGIALPKSEKGRSYVFDISDTYGKEVPLWKLDVLQDEDAVKAALRLPKQEPLREALLIGASEEAAAAAEEYWEEYLQRDSHPMTQEEMRELMEDTVCQMVMLRTGLEPLSTIRHKELLPEKGEWIGNTLSLCAQQILRQIETAVKHPERYLLAEPTANQEELQTDPEKDNIPAATEKQQKPQPAAPNLSELPISRTGDTLIIGQEEKASKEVEITVTDEEWEAIQQAIPEKLAASEPEQETAARDPLSPAYRAGDQVYIENTLFEITQVSDREVQLLDPALVYPIFRSEPREYFDRLLQQDERNRNITDFLSADLNRTDYDLREALVGDGGLMELKDKEIIAGHLRAGRGNDYIAQRLFHTFDGTTGTMTQITGSTLEYSADETGLQVQINDKTSTRKQITWAEISAVLRALFIQEQGGFLHEPQLSFPVSQSTAMEQMNFFPVENQKTEEDTVIDTVLTRGSGFEGGKTRILKFAKNDPEDHVFADFLKKEYGIGGSAGGIADNILSYDYDGKGIVICWKNKTGKPHNTHISWLKAAKIIRNLIEKGQYIDPEQMKELSANARITSQSVSPEKDPPSDFTSYQIYQLKEDPSLRDYRFLSLEIMKKHDLKFSPENYNLIYSGTVETGTTLDALYQKFNVDRPEDFTGHSLSVSDVVTIHTNGKWQAWYVDSIGFTDVSREFYLTPEAIQQAIPEKPTVPEPKHFSSAGQEPMEQISLFSSQDDLNNATSSKVSDRYSIRLLPNEGGITGIWDSTLGRFYEEDSQILRFAEQNNAISYLAKIQQIAGIEQTGSIFTTPLNHVYHIGDSISSMATEHQGVQMVIERVDEDDVWYTLPSVPEQEAVNIDRNSFERYLDTGYFSVIEKTEKVVESHAGGISPEQQTESRENTSTTEPAIVYPGDKNNLPYDVVIQPLPTNGPELSTSATNPEKSPKEVLNELRQNAQNFHITDEHLGEGGPKAKFQANISAIQLLKELESTNQQAIPEQQEILSRYVGWGGLPEAFDPSKENWSKEYNQLKELLTPEEYTAARASTLNAHYTSPMVIRAIYQAVENMGFTTGNILEPSCGVGNFFGLLPEKMQDSRLYGVELDSITGRMAKQLYPQAEITVAGFETTRRMNFYDVAVGNVPFGQYQVNDPHYNRLGFPIHDYFFAKTIDQVRPGGIIAFVTSRYTLDKQGTEAREHIARRADLLGAIRLPNTAFKANAGTEVVSDILFLQKREIPRTDLPDWVYTGRTEDGFAINRYFLQHPEMVLGELSSESTQYGHEELTVIPKEEADLKELLENAVSQIHGQITPAVQQQDTLPEDGSLPADPAVRNFSYTLVDGEVYFRENSVMTRQSFTGREKERIRDALPMRDCLRRLIQIELEDGTDQQITELQKELSQHYDRFVARNGYINTPANARVLRNDTSYPLLCSLERFNGQGQYEGKAEIFYKRTIKAQKAIDHVETAQEALTISVAEKAQVDMAYMSQLTGKREEELEQELQGKIFRDTSLINGNETWKAAFTIETIQKLPWVTAEEYLSGNVRQKLRNVQKLSQLLQERKEHTEEEKAYLTPYITALKAVQPKDLGPEEIHVRLGATWIPVKDIQDFAYETFRTSFWAQRNIQIEYSPYTAAWQIRGKGSDNGNVMVTKTFGTNRKNAWELLEDTLNLRDAQVYDYVERDGTRQAVPNPKETQLAQEKQEGIKRTFREWIWKDPKRRERLCAAYNEQFNSIRLREYDGSSIPFTGINPEIRLRSHQQNAAARIILGGNTLLAHVVGAGKTYTAIAAAMESRRLGLCQKPLFVVPNHLTEQWADDFLLLYPAANILAATKKDFEKENRQKFCSRIATGDWDAVIIGHSQFEKLPLSPERQRMMLQQQEDELISAIADAKGQEGQQFSVKQMEKSRKSLQVKLEKLNDQSRKDGVITFEEMGIDRLFVDEAHYYKNLYLYTKMRNVAGIAQSEAMKSSDLFMKCRYLDELTHGKGIIFATGTPVSNTMAELYTMQRYLQMDTLKEAHMENFDSWAANFGETVTALEISPEGSGYRQKTRFAKFYNLPELMQMFRQVADIQTADMLNLPVPEAKFHTVQVAPTELQKEMVQRLSERAEAIRQKKVDNSEDNMLLVTGDGRKLALDQRLLDPDAPEPAQGKLLTCADNVAQIYRDGQEKKLTQLVFCDMSTPSHDGKFNAYEELRRLLIERGIPEEQIAFIHDANNEAKKEQLFSSVRSGDIRILMGSTAKMGAGTNVQDRLVALHHLDCPWRPADLEQREGRAIRQGNQNKQVDIYRYVTTSTFDAYLYQMIENKQRFISQVMTSKEPLRAMEDVDEAVLSYAEVKALASGNPLIKDKMETEVQIQRLTTLKQAHERQQYQLETLIQKEIPRKMEETEQSIHPLEIDCQTAAQSRPAREGAFASMEIHGHTYSDKKEAAQSFLVAVKECPVTSGGDNGTSVGSYRGFRLFVTVNSFTHERSLTIQGENLYFIELGNDKYGNLQRLDHCLDSYLPSRLARAKQYKADLKEQMQNAEESLGKPFEREEELQQAISRLQKLDEELNLDKSSQDTAPSLPVSAPVPGGIRRPDAAENSSRLTAYLGQKGISQTVIQKCIRQKILYEDTAHNMVLVSYQSGKAIWGIRSSLLPNCNYQKQLEGSETAAGWSIEQPDSTVLHICREPVQTMQLCAKAPQDTFFSCSKASPSISVAKYLNEHPQIQTVVLEWEYPSIYSTVRKIRPDCKLILPHSNRNHQVEPEN